MSGVVQRVTGSGRPSGWVCFPSRLESRRISYTGHRILVKSLCPLSGDRDTELFLELAVHLVLGNPYGEGGYLDGEVIDFDAVEVLNVDAGFIEQGVVGNLVHFAVAE